MIHHSPCPKRRFAEPIDSSILLSNSSIRGTVVWVLPRAIDVPLARLQRQLQTGRTLYGAEDLSSRKQRLRRSRQLNCEPKPIALPIGGSLRVASAAEAMFGGRKLRIVAVVDCYAQTCPGISPRSVAEQTASRRLDKDQLARGRASTSCRCCDNPSPVTSRRLHLAGSHR